MTGGSLADSFRRLIENTGPISLQQFMGESNARYYNTRDPFGTGGDFITAPEISQMFGELAGLWLADMWIRAGRPEPVAYVEPGPGRGTLARDALRAMARYGLMPDVHLVEGSVALRAMQAQAVPQAQFHDDLSTLPTDRPILLLANEFLDALPVRQLVRTAGGWRERMVGLDDRGRFIFVAGQRPMDAAVPATRREAEEGAILETCPGAAAVLSEIATRLARQGGAALVIDYGYATPQTGSTLQAVHAHRKVGFLDMPGDADLTAHVDFPTMADLAQAHDARVLGIATQGAWLRAMGIDTRTQALAARAPHHAAELMAARDRLADEGQMGDLFKVLGLAAPGWPDGAGFM